MVSGSIGALMQCGFMLAIMHRLFLFVISGFHNKVTVGYIISLNACHPLGRAPTYLTLICMTVNKSK